MPSVVPGETSLDDMIAGLDDGVLVKHLLGFGQSDVVNGDFSSSVSLGVCRALGIEAKNRSNKAEYLEIFDNHS